MIKKNYVRAALFLAISGPVLLSYQNCANNYGVALSGPNTSPVANSAATGDTGTPTNPGPVVIPVPGNNTGSTQVALSSIRPVFAVRGINCVACHGIVGSNIVTDFGYGTANFQLTNAFFTGIRTAFNNVDVGHGVGGWESMLVSGSIIVPTVSIPAAESMTLFGVNQAMSFADVLQVAHPNGATSTSMLTGVVPATGQPALIEKSTVSISYPTQAEILALIPAGTAPANIEIAPITVAGQPTTNMSGFAVDPSGNFARNSNGTVTCTGDVVIKGPLLLKNLMLQTDQNGCRLYVSQTVFIEGPITYSGSPSANLQITSATGILMGISAQRMGAVPGLAYSSITPTTVVRTNASILTTPGGPWPRFALSEDVEFNPGGATINGFTPATFFNGLVIDALAIGPELLDAGDPSAVNNLVTGETTVTEAATSSNANVGGTRVAIDYSGLILNAPHVHSRYGGSLKGAIIADVVMLARNPTSTLQIEQFKYDTLIDSLAIVFPALTTDILQVK